MEANITEKDVAALRKKFEEILLRTNAICEANRKVSSDLQDLKRLLPGAKPVEEIRLPTTSSAEGRKPPHPTVTINDLGYVPGDIVLIKDKKKQFRKESQRRVVRVTDAYVVFEKDDFPLETYRKHNSSVRLVQCAPGCQWVTITGYRGAAKPTKRKERLNMLL
jgi:hypothetical protein